MRAKLHILCKDVTWVLLCFLWLLPFSSTAQQTNNEIYYGGKGDGYAVACFSQKDKLEKNNQIFSGGNHDGATVSCFAQAYQVENNNPIFDGGDHDGYDQSCFSQDNPPGLVNNRIFRGGNHDGSIVECYEQLDNPENPLSIELLNFDAEVVDGGVDLYWKTATETGNDYFTVQRSADGKTYHSIEKVDGAGTSTSAQRYETRDDDPLVGVSYYRLKQTDMNGDSSFSRPIAVRFAGGGEEIQIYPNPVDASENMELKLKGFDASKVLVVLRDVHGRKHFSKVVVTNKIGATVKAVDLNDRVPSGVYFVVASSNDAMYRKKLVIEK